MSLEIYNLALGLLGDFEVDAGTSNNDKRIKFCNRYYDLARDEVLSMHWWNEAIKRVDIAPESESPEGWSHKLAKPADAIRIVSVNDNCYQWQVEGQYILVAGSTIWDSDTMTVEYVHQLTDISKYSPKLKKAVAYKLAIYIAGGITNNTKVKNDLINEFETLVMPQARGIDAMQGTPRQLPKSTWLRSRI